MITRKFVAVAAIAGTALLGVAGLGASVAGADPTPPPTTTPHGHVAKCAKAASRLTKLEQRLVNIGPRIDALQKRLDAAKANHRDDLALKIQARIDRLHKSHDKLAATMVSIEKRCNLPAPPTPAPTPPPPPGAKCDKAAERLTMMEQRLVNIGPRIDALQKRLDAAKANHRDDLALKIQARIDRLNKLHHNVATRMSRIEKQCNLPAPPTPAPNTPKGGAV